MEKNRLYQVGRFKIKNVVFHVPEQFCSGTIFPERFII